MKDLMSVFLQTAGSPHLHKLLSPRRTKTKNQRPTRETEEQNMERTHFDLCGWVLFPGSSKVHAELELRHDWQGWPSSHLMRRRLEVGQEVSTAKLEVYVRR